MIEDLELPPMFNAEHASVLAAVLAGLQDILDLAMQTPDGKNAQIGAAASMVAAVGELTRRYPAVREAIYPRVLERLVEAFDEHSARILTSSLTDPR